MTGNGRNGRNGNGNGQAQNGGRKPAFVSDPTIITTVVEALERGQTDKDAAILAGVHPDTLCDWKAREGEAYDRFRQATMPARARGKAERIKGILAAGMGFTRTAMSKDGDPVEVQECPDWRALAWLLSHQYPDEFAESRRITVKDDDESQALRDALAHPDVRKALDEAGRQVGALRHACEDR